jgi:hypothetical protein
MVGIVVLLSAPLDPVAFRATIVAAKSAGAPTA